LIGHIASNSYEGDKRPNLTRELDLVAIFAFFLKINRDRHGYSFVIIDAIGISHNSAKMEGSFDIIRTPGGFVVVVEY